MKILVPDLKRAEGLEHGILPPLELWKLIAELTNRPLTVSTALLCFRQAPCVSSLSQWFNPLARCVAPTCVEPFTALLALFLAVLSASS